MYSIGDLVVWRGYNNTGVHKITTLRYLYNVGGYELITHPVNMNKKPWAKVVNKLQDLDGILQPAAEV